MLHEHDSTKDLARRIRVNAVHMISNQGFGYLGQALGTAELMAVLFGERFYRPERDYFVLSPGHYAITYYAVAAELGLIDKESLKQYGNDGALFEAISTERTPGIDITCGSLAQGLSGAIGLALAARLDGSEARTYALLSDGELEEGQTWEAAMFAAHHGLDGLTAILDVNGSQVDGPITSVTTVEPIADKWRAFGWEVLPVDGHDIAAVAEALHQARSSKRPSILVAKTDILGRLTSFPAGVDGHFIKLTKDLQSAVLAELGTRAGT
jgi:transketolase